MKVAAIVVVVIVVATMGGLLIWRQMDHWADRAEMDRLLGFQPSNPARFDPQMVQELPDPARRFFLYAIAAGTPLYTVASIRMSGQFSLGSKEAPDYRPMRAEQVLATPHGFVWKMAAGSGVSAVSGSDSAGWTRFWIMGLAPVARVTADPDARRSAFGRYVAEAAFWAPASLLPGPDVRWEPVSKDTARATVTFQGMEQSIEITVRESGEAIRVVFPRWSNANPEKTFRIQPFGGTLSNYRAFGGFKVPTRVEAGNFFGTDDYFPFFIAEVESISYPPRAE